MFNTEELSRLQTHFFRISDADLVITGLVLWGGYCRHLAPAPACPGLWISRYSRMIWYTLQYIKLNLTFFLVMTALLHNQRNWAFGMNMYLCLSSLVYEIALVIGIVALYMARTGQRLKMMLRWIITFGIQSVYPLLWFVIFLQNLIRDWRGERPGLRPGIRPGIRRLQRRFG